MGRELFLQEGPSSTCHRFVGAVAPHKFHSPQRELSLRPSHQLLHVIAEWEDRFPLSPYRPLFCLTRDGQLKREFFGQII